MTAKDTPQLGTSITLKPQPWQIHALCTRTDPDIFYPEHGGIGTGAAKQTCILCPVRAECLQYALENNEQYGVWGGKSARQRRQLRKDTA